jgi:predicted NBD/HSP70 family sugar kinase/predicted transcriptional regulator
MPVTKPSLELLRTLSDEHVLRELMRARRATRAEIAAATGLSKPTISESVKRLEAAGAVVDTGERTSGRGRVGTYYALPESVGVALVVSLAPEGFVVETLDVYGDVVSRSQTAAADVEGTLRALAGTFRLAVVSAADPVDRETGRLVELPDAPFLLGSLDPRALLGGGDVIVDNDVNWAARAEHAAPDFAYLWLGEGLGCAVVSAGVVIRGSSGVAGEIAHLMTVGPGGAAMRLTEVFATLGLRRPGSTAIDVAGLLAGPLDDIAVAVAGAVSALVALADPAVVLLGGPWGPAILDAVRAVPTPRPVPLAAATITHEPALAGARAAALEQLRDAVIADARR